MHRLCLCGLVKIGLVHSKTGQTQSSAKEIVYRSVCDTSQALPRAPDNRCHSHQENNVAKTGHANTQGIGKLDMSVQEAECKNKSSAELRYSLVLLTNPHLDNAENPARQGFYIGETFLTTMQKVQTTARL